MEAVDPTSLTSLDPDTCRRARLSRDRRFDGEFYLAVVTTGIYCRPICPARPPAEKNVRYYRSAVQAAQAGFRPCLRCRPETAPGSPAWRGASATLDRALQLIRQGALNDGSLPELAGRLGVGERYLRKLFQRELGVPPRAVALNQRLLFAKQLLAETDLPLTEVAYAAGFGSVRRFNSAVQAHFRLTPGDMRRRQGSARPGSGITLQLQYRPPYDWDLVADLFARHAIEGLEAVDGDGYRRRLVFGTQRGELRVRPLPRRHALQLELDLHDPAQLMPLVARVRRMFDLDANPAAIAGVLGQDAQLATLLRRNPGVRSPGHWSLFEACVRAVVGQQVSVGAARTVLGRLVIACNTPGFPAPADILALPDTELAMPGRRRDTLRRVCTLFDQGTADPPLEAFAALAGIGPWSVNLVRLRGQGQPDCFPDKDLGLVRAWQALSDEELSRAQQRWRPWRSYAANLLWRSL